MTYLLLVIHNDCPYHQNLYVVAKKNNMPKVSKKVIFVNFDDAYLIISLILDN